MCEKSHTFAPTAAVAQLVERNLAKVEVAGSSPVCRSVAEVVESVDTQDLKSCRLKKAVRVRVPSSACDG